MALQLPLPDPPWPQSLSPLKAVDDLLRCGICFDYFSIAMIIPQCSHNYCSLCIRKFLSYRSQCPTCSVAVSESDLKNNRTLDELVKSFNSARQQLFQLVLDTPLVSSPLACSERAAGKSHAKSPISWPVIKEEPGIDSFLRKEEVCTSTKAEGLVGTGQKSPQAEEHQDFHSSSAEVGGNDAEVGSQGSPQCTKNHAQPSTSVVKAVEKVECPVCEVAIPEHFINKHLDSCLTREEKKDSLRSSAHRRKPLSKVVYNLLSERELRRRLKEHGLSTRGSRQQLVRRHQDFVHMYNAQCDSLNPKAVAEIVQELESNEKLRVQLELHKPAGNSLTFTKDQTEEEIDEIHSDYRKKHRSEFQLLVDQVSHRWKKSGQRQGGTAGIKEGVTAREMPAATAHEEEHHTALVLGEAQMLQPETPDGKRSDPGSLEEGQRSASPAFSLSSESTSSSSSDILRDLQEPEPRSAASDTSTFLGLRANKRKSHQPWMPESNQLLPKSKRKRS